MDGETFGDMSEHKRMDSYSKRYSYPGSLAKDFNDFFRVFRGAMETLRAMKVAEEGEEFYDRSSENKKSQLTEPTSPHQGKLLLPDLQDRLNISNEQGRPARRVSINVPINKKSSRDVPAVVTVQSKAPSTRFWTHPAAPSQDMLSSTSLVNLPQINSATNFHAKSCINVPQKSYNQREEILKKGKSSSSVVSFPHKASTPYCKSLQTKGGRSSHGGSRGRYWGPSPSETKSSWKIKIHKRKEPPFTS